MSYQGLPQQESDDVTVSTTYSESQQEAKNPLVYSTESSSSGPGPRPPYGHSRFGSTVSVAIGHDFRHRYGDIAPPQWNEDEDNDRSLQTRYDPLKAGLQSQLARKHSKKHQLFHLLGKVALRLASTIILCAAMIGCFKYFETVKVLTNTEKNVFNMLSTGIYLTMGLNMAGAFKQMATMLRWKLLARKAHNLKEIDMILGLNSLVKVYKLGIEALGFRKPLTFFLCMLWIVVNLVARVSIALTGLTYSYDSAGGVGTIPGHTFISDKTAFWPMGYREEQKPALMAQYQTAHAYGEASAIMVDSDHPSAKPENYIVTWNNDTESWGYSFRTWDTPSQDLVAITNRTISINATCIVYDIIDGQDGSKPDIVYFNPDTNENVTLNDVSVRGPGATVWANPDQYLKEDNTPVCPLGTRCAVVHGFQFINPKIEAGNGKIYTCIVEISKVTNAWLPAHDFPDDIAWMAAGAIGLDGFTEDVDEWLYQRYYLGTQFGQRMGGDPKKMARLVSRFAAGVIAILDTDNPPIRVWGDKPWAGVLFKVKWLNLCLILGGITVGQLLLGLLAAFYSNTVFVKDDSYLSTARLLRPLVERLGPSGCALTGEEIASTLKTQMVYGVRVDKSNQRHHLDIGEDIMPVTKFPAGWYDGESGDMRPYTDGVTEEEARWNEEKEEEMLLLA